MTTGRHTRGESHEPETRTGELYHAAPVPMIGGGYASQHPPTEDLLEVRSPSRFAWIWKTLLVLCLMVGSGAAGYFWGHYNKPQTQPCKTLIANGPWVAHHHKIPYYQYLALLKSENC